MATKKKVPATTIFTVPLPDGVSYANGEIFGLEGPMRSFLGRTSRALQGPESPNRIPDKDRCPCGTYSKWLAAKRKHHCVRPLVKVKVHA